MTFRVVSEEPDELEPNPPVPLIVDGRNLTPQGAQATRWLIVGAGGFGREVYSWTFGRLWSTASDQHVAFLDDNPHALDPFPRLKSCWSGRISDYSPLPGDRLLMALGDPAAKLTIGKTLQSRGAVFASYVHPSAIIAQDVQIGVGCVICPFAVTCCNVRLGDFVLMNVGSLAGHDSVIGDGCTLSPHSDVAGQVQLERGVFLGCQTVIVPNTRVGEFSRIGAGSVVISNVRAGVSMMGVPAKRINWMKNDDEELLAS
ncbi:acetyltransferase [Schlesneria sp.]|uniref:acetyltransferase n=1 Tax=Schlesneria sp. TaxID=2762018 RepID=UPI002F0F41B2